MYASITKSTIIAFALAGLVAAAPHPQAYPDKCGDQVCPSDKPLCCEVPFNGGIGIECLAGPTCPPLPTPTPTATPIQARQDYYPNKCGDMVCPSDKPLCCGVYFNGELELECAAGTTCPPIQYPTTTTTQSPQIKRTAPASPTPTFGPKCGDSFFCKPGQVCCTLYTCADTPEQCPPQ